MSDDMVMVTLERIEKALSITAEARKLLSPLVTADSHLGKILADMLRMADDYIADASHFRDKGDLVRAHAASSYAHAWLDASVRIGLADGHGDDRLFTLP